MAQGRERPLFDEIQRCVYAMTTTMEELVSLLGSSYTAPAEGAKEDDSSHSEEDQQRFMNLFDEQSDDRSQPSIAFPSLSLDRDTLQEEGTKEESRSKDEVQHHTAGLLAREISLHEPEEFHLVPSVILENFFSAFDTLVDARILVYSKILRSHARSLAECRDESIDANASLNAVEYKLKTLLEIGTNLTAEKVVTNFSIQPSFDRNDVQDGDEITIPITMEARINQLQIPSPHDGVVANIPLDFKADGVIKGTFNPENSRLSAVTVDVDCDALLSSMISQAALVVSAVVDVTNEAWARNLPAPEDNTSAAAASARSGGASPEKESLNNVAANMNNGGNLNIIGDSSNDLVMAGLKRSASASDDDARSYDSFENATHIVDYVIGELDETVMALPLSKKQRIS